MARSLHRSDIEAGIVEKALREAEQLGLIRLRSPEERAASLAGILEEYPDTDGVWVFCYGSLIWNPTFDFDETRHGVVYGYHRRFCLWTSTGRGSPEQPGLVLGLDQGGCCQGVLYRVPPDIAEGELKVLWDREMAGDAYIPRIVRVRLKGSIVNAVTFVMDRKSRPYAGRLSDEEAADAIAHAEGWLGSSRDYLFQTVEHLNEAGLKDHHLTALAALVRQRL